MSAVGARPNRALLIDLDGTLVDSAKDMTTGLNQLRADLGRAPLAEAAVRQMVGDGVGKLVERCLRWQAEDLPAGQSLPDLIQQFLAHYEVVLADRTQPFPGVVEALTALRADGWRLAVCTNKPEAASRAILAALDLSRFFDQITGGDSYAERKPDATPLLATLEAIDARPEVSLMIGDSAVDLAAGRNAGLPVILVTYGYTREPVQGLGADHLVDSFAALPALIRLHYPGSD